MSLHLQMIGTGSAFSKKYYNNNALLRCNGFTLMIDCGVTATRALDALKIDLGQLDGVLITHIHADHVGGLEEIAFQLLYVFRRRIKLLVPSLLKETLWIHTLKGGLENKEEGFCSLDDYFDVVVLEPHVPFPIAGREFTVELVPTRHIPNKPSYSLYLNGKVFYSSDARFDPALLADFHRNRGCEAILHDCQLFEPGTVHASLAELLTLPEDIQRKVLLMHYGDNKEEFEGKTGAMTFIEQGKIYRF